MGMENPLKDSSNWISLAELAKKKGKRVEDLTIDMRTVSTLEIYDSSEIRKRLGLPQIEK